MYNAAVAYHQMGDIARAEVLYREGLDVHAGNVGLQDALITLLMQSDRWEEASAMNQALRASRPGETQQLERQAYIESQLRDSRGSE